MHACPLLSSFPFSGKGAPPTASIQPFNLRHAMMHSLACVRNVNAALAELQALCHEVIPSTGLALRQQRLQLNSVSS